MCEYAKTRLQADLPVIIPKTLNMSDNPAIYVCAVHVHWHPWAKVSVSEHYVVLCYCNHLNEYSSSTNIHILQLSDQSIVACNTTEG